MTKTYIYDGITYKEMPYWIWPNTSPITDAWFISHGGSIREVPDPVIPTIKTYSTYLIKRACEKRNLWTDVKTYIEQAGKWDSFLLIKEVSSDNEELIQVLPALKQAFGEELAEAVLEESTI